MSIQTTSNHSNPNQFKWIDVQDPSFEDLKKISAEYGISESSLKDCLEPYHLPKFESHDHFAFILVRMIDPNYNSESGDVNELTRKIALFVGDQFLITIHRSSIPFLNSFKESSFKHDRNQMVFQIMNHCFNSYDPLIDQSIEFVNGIEHHTKIILRKVYQLKKQASTIKRLLRLSHEVCVKISLSSDFDLKPIGNELKEDLENTIFFTEDLNEGIHHFLNLYLSIQSQRTNETMRIMAIFSAFFMPITFIVGVYGMNFKFMPELEWQYGYPMAIALMLFTTIAIFIWFKRNKWL